MDLDASLLRFLCLPTGAFADPPHTSVTSVRDQEGIREHGTSAVLWDGSQTNPANRLLSLTWSKRPSWRVEGCDSQGTQLQVLPVFLRPALVPLRIDVFIPNQSRWPPALRDVLDSGAAFCVHDDRVAALGISKLVVQALDHWSNSYQDFHAAFHALPFGSRIVVENICPDPAAMRVRMIPDCSSERQMLSKGALQQMWRLPANAWPTALDLGHLQHVRQLHDTISLVHIPSCGTSNTYVFKSSVQDVKYLYHELKLLLTMTPHPGIIAAPLYLVTQKDRYGGLDKLYGFILPYHPAGNLAEILGARSEAGTLRLQDQCRWATEVTRTLMHVHHTSASFYSELKADNLLLSTDADGVEHIVFIDFEQMGNWATFSAPEIHYLEYLLQLSASEDIPEVDRQRYTALVARYLPADHPPSLRQHLYANPPQGYYRPWLALGPAQREAAEVFSLGKLLWCIFEGRADPRISLLKAFRHEPLSSPWCAAPPALDVEFPTFRRTPGPMRALIRRCTRGDPLWRPHVAWRRGIVRVGARAFPRGRSGVGGEPRGTAREALEAAQEGWRETLGDMEAYLEAWGRWKRGGASQQDEELLGFTLRPPLQEVLDCLLTFGAQRGSWLPGVTNF